MDCFVFIVLIPFQNLNMWPGLDLLEPMSNCSRFYYDFHWKPRLVIMSTLSSQPPHIMTTICGAASDAKVGIMKTLGCRRFVATPSQIARLMGPTWGPSGSCRPQMGPMLATWTLLSGLLSSNLDSWGRQRNLIGIPVLTWYWQLAGWGVSLEMCFRYRSTVYMVLPWIAGTTKSVRIWVDQKSGCTL